MTDAPERIWLDTASKAENWTGHIGEALLEETCYLRFDTVEARLAAAERLAKALEDISHGRGMFGIDGAKDAQWASHHAETALTEWEAAKGERP